MKPLTSQERILRMFEHREADRIALFDEPWNSTVARWEREGMPKTEDPYSYMEYLGLDLIRGISVNNSARYPEKVLEETDEYKIYTSKWGVTMKQWKHAASTPEFLDFTITDPQTWEAAKKRIDTAPDRIDWKWLEHDYPKWQKQGAWIIAQLSFGFDPTHSWVVGTERVLMAIVENPEWLMDMFDTELSTAIKLYDMLWEKGYRFHGIKFWDDMGYKKNQFFSLDTYRNFLKPFHKRAIDWAHNHGVKAYLHSCGDINPFVPELVDMGLDMLNPIEVKAGMDPYHLKSKFGNKLAFHGGLNALLYENPPALYPELERLIPAMKENGGYIFGSDHSVPDSVSLEEFKKIINRVKELGTYGR
jgi:uroporphyrinogen decarboxylase